MILHGVNGTVELGSLGQTRKRALGARAPSPAYQAPLSGPYLFTKLSRFALIAGEGARAPSSSATVLAGAAALANRRSASHPSLKTFP